MKRGILVSSSKSLIHTCTNIYTVREYLRTYLHHWAFVVLQYSAIQTKCFKLCINRFRTQRGVLCVWDPEDNTEIFSSICETWAAVEFEMKMHTSIQAGCFNSHQGQWGLNQLHLRYFWCTRHSARAGQSGTGPAGLWCPSGAAAGDKMGWPIAPQMALADGTGELEIFSGKL